MDDLIEFILEIVLEGAVEVSGSKQVPLPLRVAIAAALLLLFYGLAALIFWVGADSGNLLMALLGIVMFAGFTALAVLKIREFRRR